MSEVYESILFEKARMELTKESNHALVTVVVALTVIVFVLDLLTPSEIAVWTLYLVPLGINRWSSSSI